MTIADPTQKVTAAMMLDLLQELRDAGAEVVQYGANRVVASSWFSSSGGQLQVDGQPLSRPFTVLAIGDKATMASALNIPGGIVETLRRADATADHRAARHGPHRRVAVAANASLRSARPRVGYAHQHPDDHVTPRATVTRERAR